MFIALQLYMSELFGKATVSSAAATLGVRIIQRVVLYDVGHGRVLYYIKVAS